MSSSIHIDKSLIDYIANLSKVVAENSQKSSNLLFEVSTWLGGKSTALIELALSSAWRERGNAAARIVRTSKPDSMPVIETSNSSPVQPGYLDKLNGELAQAQEFYLNSPKDEKKQLKSVVTRIESEIERVHALHVARSPLSGPVTYLWATKGTLGLRLEVPKPQPCSVLASHADAASSHSSGCSRR